jgi:hypothetical protein
MLRITDVSIHAEAAKQKSKHFPATSPILILKQPKTAQFIELPYAPSVVDVAVALML